MFDESIVEYSNYEFNSKEDVIDYLATMLYQKNKISNVNEYVSAVLRREYAVSTEIGHEIAIPHGESESVIDNFVACIRLSKPIKWDEKEVSLVFIIGVPLEKRNKLQIKILAQLCSNFMIKSFRDKLFEAKNKNELFNVLKTIEEEECEKS